MARADLNAMLGRLEDPSETTAPEPVAPAAKETSTALPASTSRTTQPQPSAASYLSFERKETRLRVDHISRLTEEARRLNRAKGAGGERITENTLIRVAIDLLLVHSNQLAGVNEDELRKSVGL